MLFVEHVCRRRARSKGSASSRRRHTEGALDPAARPRLRRLVPATATGSPIPMEELDRSLRLSGANKPGYLVYEVDNAPDRTTPTSPTPISRNMAAASPETCRRPGTSYYGRSVTTVSNCSSLEPRGAVRHLLILVYGRASTDLSMSPWDDHGRLKQAAPARAKCRYAGEARQGFALLDRMSVPGRGAGVVAASYADARFTRQSAPEAAAPAADLRYRCLPGHSLTPSIQAP